MRSVIAVGALALAGCGAAGEDQLPREPVSGSVTFDGQPLKKGTIQFQPSSQKESVASGGMVAEGRFEVPRPEGPVPGKYKVMIYAEGNSVSAGSAEGVSPGLSRSKSEPADTTAPIPARYNVQTELTAEVKSGGPNTFTFDLKK
jgi:hypothetical protein